MFTYTILVSFENRVFTVRVFALGPVLAKRAAEAKYKGAKTRIGV